MSDKLKAVFDTQIFLRALIKSASVNARITSLEFRNSFVLYISDAIEAEIVEVLNRPRIRSKFPQITDDLVAGTLSDLRQAQRVTVDVVEQVSRDPKDDMFLACAKAAEADYLVSADNDLLVLEQYGSTRIVDAVTFLDVLIRIQENRD
ncbi:MAG: putative toxin-antitoxin system toxin component, PIN family [Anaerolineae bacterium]|nr:putative toxin-antitoxin system toxin component, PIN family [Anaerolineae bacterium]